MVDADFNFKMPKIEMAEMSEDGKYGRFVVEPLERGYGLTLGNSLRRIMLSSLVGTAVSSVKIDGVLHEFSSIPGVKEDVTEIIMNIKQLAIKNNGNSVEPVEAHIDFVGEGVVKASDIQVDPDIEIVNPDLVIAHLNGGADCKLSMELTITNGRGYVSSEKNKKEDQPVGVIAIDSIYTPVERVNMSVQNTRVGQDTDFDKLTLDNYYKTDTHWKQEDLFDVANTIAKQMNFDITNNNVINTVTTFKGSYAGRLSVTKDIDTIKTISNSSTLNSRVYNYETKKYTKIYDYDKIKSLDKYDIYLSGASSIIDIVNPTSNSNKELIVFRDSYGSSLIPLLIEGYKKITVIDIRYVSSRILNNYIKFNNQDVLFMYSILTINNSFSMR